MTHNTTDDKATIRERLLFLQQKNEALQLEVSHLTDQNSKLDDQLEVMRKINLKLKQRLATAFQKRSLDILRPLLNNFFVETSVGDSMLSNKSSPGKMRRAQTAVFDVSPIRKAESLNLHSGQFLPPILEKDDNIENERIRDHSVGMILDSFKDLEYLDSSPALLKNLSSKFTAEKESPITHASIESKGSFHFQLEAKKLIEQQEKFSQKVEQDELKEIQEMLEGVLNEPGKFQELNHMVNLGPHSPFSKSEMMKAEKYIEGAECIVKKWTKQLLEVNKNCLAYTKSIEGFGNQLLMDKGFFKNNIELQTLLALISQVMKEHAIYIEVFTQVVESSIESPLKEFYKNTLRSYKEPKRKMQKTMEDFEAHQLKFLAQKKASISKEGGSPSNVQKSYTASLKVFENARLEYIHCLNDITVEINVEIIEKLCNFVTGRMVHLTSTYEILHGIEKQVKLFTENRCKKIKMQENLGSEFEKCKLNLAENVCLEYNLPPLPNVIKQGYLFIKPENKEIKKKYCLIGEDGILYWVKEAENCTDEPQFTELSNLKLCSVKIKNDTEHIFSFELVDPHQKKPIMIQTESEQSTNDWICTIRNVTEKALYLNGSLDEVPRCSRAESDTKSKNLSTKTIGNLESSPESKQQKGKQLLISNIIKNNVCADCGSKDPSWVSLNLGVIICINCSGVHRQLGPNISKVRSLKLDNLTNTVLKLFSSLPTEGVNAIWEGYIEQTPSLKPNLESSKEKRAEWVRLKYVDRAIVRRLREEDHIGTLCKALEEKDLLKALHVLVYTKKNLNEKYVIEGRKQTVLHYACAKSSAELVELLMRNGCDVQAEDEDNCKPIERALLANNIEIVELLHGNVKGFEV